MAQLKTINFYNENGNISARTRSSLKEQAVARVLHAISQDEMLDGVVRNVNGGISVPLCATEKGETVYAHLDIVVSTKSPDVKVEHKKKAKTAEPAPVVGLWD